MVQKKENPRSDVSPTPEATPNGEAAEAKEEPGTGPESSLYSHYEERVRPCIDLIDSLRALGVEQDLALPAIAVIGDQSSGKSSVLEALSGVALPRGSGIVTRCPLVLRLKKLVHEDAWRGHLSYRDFTAELAEPSQVEGEVNKAQNVMAGEGVGISHELITLEISSPHVPDLTLIDLPGITRVAVGNQPQDISNQIKSLIRKYIQREQTINLVVVPCNVDIATTEALSMAQEVDPNGDRTLGILTKPDLVDKGTEDKVVDVARNFICPLKKGYMVVRCRGQKDIQDRLDLTEALQREKAFFAEHPHFRELLEEGRATIPSLADKLTSELISHICRSLPMLEEQIKRKHELVSEELQKSGAEIPEEENGRLFFLIDKISQFNQDISTLADGEEAVRTSDMRLFTKIRREFHKWGDEIEKNFQTDSLAIRKELSRFENQYRGRELPGFVNYKTFEAIVRRQVKALEEPAVQMLHRVMDMARVAFVDAAERNFTEFFNLYRTSKAKIEDIKAEQEQAAEQSIRLHFQMEQIVYCQDRTYRKALQEVRGQGAQAGAAKQAPPPLEFSMDEIFEHLDAYHGEASSRLSSHVPLVIQFYVLRGFRDLLHKSMLQLLQDRDQYAWLLRERGDTCDRRRRLKEKLARLAQALRELGRFPG